jgi:ribosome biogenesis GTPase
MFDPSFDALIPLGWGARVQALFSEFDSPDITPGRVTRVQREACVVSSPSGSVVARATELPAVGDWVALRTVDRDLWVHAILPRWSRLARAGVDARGTQVLAANVDVVLITAPADRLSPARVERELVVAWDSGAQPLVVLTKHDLAPDGLADGLATRLVGVDVVATSTRTGDGIDTVAARLTPDRTGVLLGPSGSGKSSLINALLGEGRLAVGDVRDGDRRGRHTTTWRELIPLPTGGVLIDTPGVRGVGLVEGSDGLADTFAEIDDLAGSCRFSDCSHSAEPGCALLEAVADGRVSTERLTSWRKLQREAARFDPAARRRSREFGRQHVKGMRQRRNLEARFDSRQHDDD